MAANRLAKHTVPVPSHSSAVGMRNRIRAAPIRNSPPFSLIGFHARSIIIVKIFIKINSKYFYCAIIWAILTKGGGLWIISDASGTCGRTGTRRSGRSPRCWARLKLCMRGMSGEPTSCHTASDYPVPVLPRQRGLHPGTGRGKTEQIGSAPETNCLRGVYHQPPERETGSTRRDTVWVNWALSVLEMK